MEKPEDILRKLKPVIGKKADSLWKYYLSEDEKGKKEIENLINILSYRHLNKGIDDEEIMLVPPDVNRATGDFELGNIIYNGKEVCPIGLKEKDLIKQVIILAITGGGKTNVSSIIALNLLKRKIPFMVIDWKRTWRNLLSLPERKNPGIDKIRIFTVGRKSAPFYWNPFRPPPNVHWKTWIAIMTEALEKSHLGGLGVADIFMQVYEKIFLEMGFGEERQERYPNFYDGLKELRKVDARARELLWKQSAGRVLKSFTFGPHAIAFNVRNPVKIEEILKYPVIIELDQEMPKPLRTFFMEIILRWIHLYRLSEGGTEKLKHVMFLEEIHNLFPKTRIEFESTNSLENLFREIRETGQGIISITQHSCLLPLYVLGNCNTQIIMSLQHGDDIKTCQKSLFLEYNEQKYLDKLKVGEAIVKIKDRINPCHVKFPLINVKKGND